MLKLHAMKIEPIAYTFSELCASYIYVEGCVIFAWMWCKWTIYLNPTIPICFLTWCVTLWRPCSSRHSPPTHGQSENGKQKSLSFIWTNFQNLPQPPENETQRKTYENAFFSFKYSFFLFISTNHSYWINFLCTSICLHFILATFSIDIFFRIDGSWKKNYLQTSQHDWFNNSFRSVYNNWTNCGVFALIMSVYRPE